jgi:hypothetical protein
MGKAWSTAVKGKKFQERQAENLHGIPWKFEPFCQSFVGMSHESPLLQKCHCCRIATVAEMSRQVAKEQHSKMLLNYNTRKCCSNVTSATLENDAKEQHSKALLKCHF